MNTTGCFLIGLLWGLSERFPLRPLSSVLIFTGILGAFTTFSTYGLESFNLLRDGEVGAAVVNLFASSVLGLFVVYLGSTLARTIPALLGAGGEA